MKEIGGYFELEQFSTNEYHKNLLPLNSGRNALLYILKAKRIKKLFIPHLLCDSIRDICSRHGYVFDYYNINTNFMPTFNHNLAADEYLLIVNYYGQLTNEAVRKLKHTYTRVILDNTHAFFQKPIAGIDTIYSCRKFFGVPDGAYLSTDTVLEDELKLDVSKDRMSHILGRFEGTASDYYSSFQKNDETFKSVPLMQMSKLTRNILGAVDYEKVKKTREDNYAYLDSKLKGINKLQIVAPVGAFAYPFYVVNGIEVRKKLARKKIYIPTLWPDVLKVVAKGSVDYDYAANLLPLPCDQRYNIVDMARIIDSIFGGIKGV